MTVGTSASRASGTRLGDILREFWSYAYQVGGYKLVNPDATARAAQIILGQPVKASSTNMVFVKSTDEGNAIGLVLHNQPVALAISETTTLKYPVLLRGPALIDKDALPTADVAGTAFDTVAELVAAYAALDPPILTLTEPTQTSEQTT